MADILSAGKIIELMQEAGYGEIAEDILDRRKVGERGWRQVEDPIEIPPAPDDSVSAGWEEEPGKHTAEWWLNRVIPPRVKLIGPLVTASRSMLFAPTGLGKTHFAMAIACAVASGNGIFHGGPWLAPEARRVLYVDGEMPLALLQQRLQEAVGRAGAPDGRLMVLSTADFQEVPALNTAEGQAWINGRIAAFMPDLIIFDNVQALIAGDMKDTEGWRMLQPWMRSLTDAGMAQLWVHHANADGTMYGDKTRTWQLDTVIALKRVSDVPSELCFDLAYEKARERHPGKNGSEYREGRVTLQGNIWRFQEAREVEVAGIYEVLKAAGRQMKTSELAAMMGMSRRAVEQKAKKWSRYIVAGTSPIEWALPVAQDDSRLRH